ncbi:cell division protein ZapE [Shewanella sp. MF05960]|uniref:cell division protein ZapE n=1 Tax=Shewanella sp. MF05960 TaxID=3434874 RepID=UPI003D7BC7EA
MSTSANNKSSSPSVIARSNAALSQVATDSPLQAYQKALNENLQQDPAQQQALLALEALYQQHITTTSAVKGLYMWGDVGRGKTFLMDLFYQCINQYHLGKQYHRDNQAPILRLHFHRFMAMIHQQLNQTSGIRDPLTHIAKQIASQYQLICFDEFFVSDIGDAILLARLFDTLFHSGVTLVATSNIPIVDLYKNGLQRDRFLPTIDLLQRFTQEIHLDGDKDHRMSLAASRQHPQTSLAWVSLPSIEDADDIFTQMSQLFSHTSVPKISQQILRICQRDIAIEARHDRLGWFEFSALCEGPRSALDYIEIASQFSYVLLSNVPQLGGQVRSWIRARGTEDGSQATVTGERQLAYASEDDPARRFISLVDELYDQKVILIIHSHWLLDELYLDGALSFEFRRTYSRLTEMKQWAISAANEHA